MTDLLVHPATGPLTGSVPVPSDKSIGHRALLFSSIAEGTSTIKNFSFGEDNVSTADCMRAMGVTIEQTGPSELRVTGVGLRGLRAPQKNLDCGNSGTTMRLLCGLLCAQPFESTLVGDASLSRRPMMRVIGPLRKRGARIEGTPHPKKQGDVTAPLHVLGVREGEALTAIEYESPISSAQVKSAMLLSGLYANGPTYFKEPTISRDHTERVMLALGVPIRTMGTVIELDPKGWDGKLAAQEFDIPGDISAAAFLLVAAQLVEGSRVTVRAVGTNPTRTGLLDVLRDMGAGIQAMPGGERGGEPVAEITAWPGSLRGGKIGGELVPRAIDEIPILCALAVRAKGTTEIRDAEELRVKESDRIAVMVQMLRSFGVACEEKPDGMIVEGTDEPLTPVEVESKGDHRIAMTAAVLALLGSGPSKIRDCDCVATSFPKFVGTLRALGARIDVA
jgi:3-phosphoshikimate 1-carboxyvinyltransferase